VYEFRVEQTEPTPVTVERRPQEEIQGDPPVGRGDLRRLDRGLCFSPSVQASSISPSSARAGGQIDRRSEVHVIEGRVEGKGTLFKSLSGKKVPIQWIDLVVSNLKPLVNFKKSKGEHTGW